MTGDDWIIRFNTLRPRQDGRHFPDDIFKCIFLNENVWSSIVISLKFVTKGLINNIPALVQIMAWRRPGDKPLSELMMVSLPTHICVTRPQWVNSLTMERGSPPFTTNNPQIVCSNFGLHRITKLICSNTYLLTIFHYLFRRFWHLRHYPNLWLIYISITRFVQWLCHKGLAMCSALCRW